MLTYNVNGCVERSRKILKAMKEADRHLGVIPDVVMIQEARRSLFKSHIGNYHVIQKFATEFSTEDTTRISQSGTGNVILIKEGLSFNQLAWASWEDQINSVIIFEQRDNVQGQEIILGTIFMSIYRKHDAKNKNLFYKRVEERILAIR